MSKKESFPNSYSYVLKPVQICDKYIRKIDCITCNLSFNIRLNDKYAVLKDTVQKIVEQYLGKYYNEDEQCFMITASARLSPGDKFEYKTGTSLARSRAKQKMFELMGKIDDTLYNLFQRCSKEIHLYLINDSRLDCEQQFEAWIIKNIRENEMASPKELPVKIKIGSSIYGLLQFSYDDEQPYARYMCGNSVVEFKEDTAMILWLTVKELEYSGEN